MRRWLLKKFGVIRAANEAELQILEGIGKLKLDADIQDDITEVVMTAMNKVRNK